MKQVNRIGIPVPQRLAISLILSQSREISKFLARAPQYPRVILLTPQVGNASAPFCTTTFLYSTCSNDRAVVRPYIILVEVLKRNCVFFPYPST